MDYKNYMNKLVRLFRDNHTSQYMFIKHYETLHISEPEIREIILDKKQDLCLLFYEFPMHSMQEPYAPFLGWVRDVYNAYFKNKETPEEFVKNANVYPLQQEIFSSYIRYGKASRKEDIMLVELQYEKMRLLNSLVNLYQYIGSKKDVFIFIEKLHLANSSCIHFLYRLMTGEQMKNIKLLATYNEVYRIPDHIAHVWREFTDEMERRNLQYEWNSVSIESTVDSQDFFIPNEKNIEEYLHIAVNMYYLLTSNDARYYLERIYEKIEQDVFKISQENYIVFMELFSLTLIFEGEYARAVQICDRVGLLGKEMQDDRVLYNYNYISAIAQFGMEQLENKVNSYIDRCIKLAKKWDDPLAEFKPELLRVISNCNYWRDTFNKNFSRTVSQEMLYKAEAYGFLNTLSHFLVFCFENHSEEVEGIIEGKVEPKYFNKGIELGERLDNKDFLIGAYTKNIVLFSKYGKHSVVDGLNQKKLEIFEQENNIVRKVHTYNGLGYNAGVAEQYVKAEGYFNQSMNESLLIRDEQEIAITVYNSAINKILAREYADAAEDLNLLIKIMDMLGIHSLSICSTAKIYGLLGFCSFYMGEEYICYLCLNRIEAYVGHLQHVQEKDKYNFWHDTLFFKHMIQGMLFTREGRMIEAGHEYERADFHQASEVGNRYFNYPIYVMEMANFYSIQNMEQERIRILEDGIAFCNEYGYHLKSKMFLNELNHRTGFARHIILPKREASTEHILDVVEGLAVKKNLENSQKDIGFLTVWQELLNKNTNADDMLAQAMSLLKNHFNLDGVAMISKNQESAEVTYFDGPDVMSERIHVTKRLINFTNLECEKFMEYFQEHKHALLTNRIDKGFLEHKGVLELLDINHVITLFAVPLSNNEGKLSCVIFGYVEMQHNFIENRYLLQQRHLVILNFVSNQLYIAMERLNHLQLIKRMNSQLRDMAVTDLLTGLYNRQGFERRIREDHKKENENNEENVVLYLDLDNFKYYNDTFGHEVGDYVLVRFAQILEKVVDGIGYAVRYGGDEFVLVFNGRDAEFGKKIAKNIFFMLADGLYSVVERKVGHSVVIPPNKRLSCSIGISSCIGHDAATISKALNEADKGLYYVKKTTKSNYVVWNELEESQMD